jgi:hypothetical protein
MEQHDFMVVVAEVEKELQKPVMPAQVDRAAAVQVEKQLREPQELQTRVAVVVVPEATVSWVARAALV